MLIVNGRIVYFLIDRDNRDGYAEFVFKSDYDKDRPRFEAICCGKIPDVVPGVPIVAEFKAETFEKINTIEIKSLQSEKISKEFKNDHKNEIVYTCINFHDEEYALTLLKKIKGISTKTANKILDAVDGDLSKLSLYWDDKDFWSGFRGARRYLEELKESLGKMIEKDILVKRYSKYGIGYPQIDYLLDMYSYETEAKIHQNPYMIMSKLDLGFQVADVMAKDFGFNYLSPERVRAIIYQVLNDNESSGNTAIKIKDFYIKCAGLHNLSAWQDYVVSPYIILSHLSKMKTVYSEEGLIGYIDTLNKESDIAYKLKKLMSANTNLNTNEEYFNNIKDKYNKEQLDFLRMFDKESVVLLLGRGGTGKTHTICGAINLMKNKNEKYNIRLCAPTARAAGVLKEHSGCESSTIHIMLELSPYTDEAGVNEDNPLESDLIVVDEMSMVDTNVMYHLMNAVKQGTKLILCGDPDQLESVGCGAVLRDLIDSDVIPKVKLKKIMRQNEGSAVIENCGRILKGRSDFKTNNKFIIRNCKTEEEAKAFLKSEYDNDSVNSQILSTTKKGIIGTISLNKEFESIEKQGIYLHGEYFCEGDKVIFTRNNYDGGYCNGDIGFVQAASMPLKVKMVSDNTELEIDKELAADMEHAEAITIHKSQGSEYQKVYILLPDKPVSLLTRNMVNTAISRTKDKAWLITVGDSLKVSAANKYKKERITRLQQKIINSKETKSV